MKRKLMLLLACLFVGIGLVTAQTQKVTGVVISEEDGQPVIGASVLVKGTQIGAITNVDGDFTLLNVPSSAKTLQISHIGMQTQEVAIKPNLKVVLKPDTEVLDEVVVTGYGTFKKSSFTGSASNVTTEKLQDLPSISVQDRLAGSVAGVQITSTSGQPGSVASVRIRGMGSINASNEPLYVIDGVPMLNGNVSEFTYADSGNSLMATLNSNDIESMTVIKDAAAASLYGSRAANGVIVITTKKGSAGKTKIGVRADWGMSNMAIDYRPILDGKQRREILHLGFENYAKYTLGYDAEQAAALANKDIDEYAAEPWSGYTDWKDVLFRNGSHQNYEVNAQGGNEKTRFYTSFAYTKQEGITNVSGYERFTGRANVTHQTDKVLLEANAMYTNSTQNVNNEGTSFASPIMCYAMTASPSTYPYNEDGSFSSNFPALNGANPIQTETYNYNRATINRFLGSMAATWTIWDNLKLKEAISYDFNQNNERIWWDPRSNDGRSSNGVYQRVMGNRGQLNTQTQLSYNKSFGLHNLDALVGFETEDYKYDYLYANGNQYPSYLPEIENAGDSRASSHVERYRMTSFLGRINYDYNNKYYFSASYRRDGSSRLSRESRWGDFWSISGSWRLSEEAFMQDIKHVLTDAKLRVSYGVNGTQPTDLYGYLGVYEFGYNYAGNGGSAEARFDNPNMKWEKNYATNVGLDVTLWNRLSITAEWYNRDTKDLLMSKNISAVPGVINSSGGATMLMNVGSMRNRGVEFEIKSTNIQNKDWYWSTSLNFGHNKNTLLKLDGEQNEMIDGIAIHRIGEAYQSFYAYEYAGVDPETGSEMFYINGEDGSRETTIHSNEANKVIIGSPDPKLTGGLTNFVSWKFIDLNFTLTYSLGGHAYDAATWLQSNGGTYNYVGNVPAYYKIEDTWKQPGDNAKLPLFAYGNKNTVSSRWMMPTDHLRLKNLTIGFTLPSNLSKKAGINKLRAYISGNNLLTWKSKDLYVDPETPVDGLCYFETPALRTITFGIELGF